MVELRQVATRGTIHYQRRRPEDSVLCHLVQGHAEAFFAEAQPRTGSALPKFIRDEFQR